jgi:hypothetical protein
MLNRLQGVFASSHSHNVRRSRKNASHLLGHVAQALVPAASRLIGTLAEREPKRLPMSRGRPLGPAD